MQELLTANELATRLRVSLRTVNHWTQNGRIPCIKLSQKVVRFNWEEVQRALTVPAASRP